MLGLLLAVVVAVGSSQDSLASNREELVGRLKNLQTNVGKVSADIQSEFPKYSQRPQTGILVQSDPAPGSDNLHWVIVKVVYGEGPAGRAGIKPGDRIIAIGSRRLEHETADIADNLMNGIGGPIELALPRPIPMTLQRNGTNLTVIVQREILPCAQEVARAIKKEWLPGFLAIQGTISELLKAIADDPQNPILLSQASNKMTELVGIAVEASQTVQSKLFADTRLQCKAEY